MTNKERVEVSCFKQYAVEALTRFTKLQGRCDFLQKYQLDNLLKREKYSEKYLLWGAIYLKTLYSKHIESLEKCLFPDHEDEEVSSREVLLFEGNSLNYIEEFEVFQSWIEDSINSIIELETASLNSTCNDYLKFYADENVDSDEVALFLRTLLCEAEKFYATLNSDEKIFDFFKVCPEVEYDAAEECSLTEDTLIDVKGRLNIIEAAKFWLEERGDHDFTYDEVLRVSSLYHIDKHFTLTNLQQNCGVSTIDFTVEFVEAMLSSYHNNSNNYQRKIRQICSNVE